MAVPVISSTVLKFCWNVVCQVGYDKQGLPIGMQLIGRPWCEASILRLAAAIEVWFTLSTNELLAVSWKRKHHVDLNATWTSILLWTSKSVTVSGAHENMTRPLINLTILTCSC